MSLVEELTGPDPLAAEREGWYREAGVNRKAPKETPILFSGPMVRAILEGRKTQTRRVVSRVLGHGPVTEFIRSDTRGYDWTFRNPRRLWQDLRHAELLAACPYGQPGDRLWVRETWTPADTGIGETGLDDTVFVYYRADHEVRADGAVPVFKECPGLPEETVLRWQERIEYAESEGGDFWVPSIHMPRWASRLTLEITGVRVERLQSILEEEARAEGVAPSWLSEDGSEVYPYGAPRFKRGFAQLWREINGPGSWDLNPYVWVVSFRKVEG